MPDTTQVDKALGQRIDDPLRWHRAVALAFAVLFGMLTVAACWMVATKSMAIDFLSYWAASRLAIEGDPALAYDIAAHKRMEATVAPIEDGLLPFPYPPPFLLFVLPFGLLPFGIANACWILLTGSLYHFAARRLTESRVLFAQPSAMANGLIGQNGFLTASIFIAGSRLLDRRPLLGGAILGMLVFKPQLALLLPVAVLAGRIWPAVAGAAISAVVLLGVGLLAFGIEAYEGFLAAAPVYTTFMQQSRWPWAELASTFAFCRWFGIAPAFSLAIHGIVAAAATFGVWQAWRTDHPAKIAILAAGTMLIPPYLFTYDSLLLVVPISFLMRQGRNPVVVGLIWLGCLLPVASYFGLYPGPNTISVSAAASLLVLYWNSQGDHDRPAAVAA